MPHGLAASFTLLGLIEIHLNASADSFANPVFQSIANLLADLELPKELTKYMDNDQVFSLIDEMFDPSRAANFVHFMDRKNLYELLKFSLGLKK